MSERSADDVISFERTPDGPACLADGPGTSVSAVIDASPGEVWPVITDIGTPIEFSDELQGAEWSEGAQPGPDATFVGHNRNPAMGDWTTTNFVTEFEPHLAFAWSVSSVDDPAARWRYDLTEVEGGTRLDFAVVLGPGPSGLTTAIESMPDKEERIIRRRIGDLRDNMQRTVDGIKRIVEATGSSGT